MLLTLLESKISVWREHILNHSFMHHGFEKTWFNCMSLFTGSSSWIRVNIFIEFDKRFAEMYYRQVRVQVHILISPMYNWRERCWYIYILCPTQWVLVSVWTIWCECSKEHHHYMTELRVTGIGMQAVNTKHICCLGLVCFAVHSSVFAI